jgi:predicted transcriptional regulator of viral defense system
MKHDGFFRMHPVFTVADLAEHMSSRAGVGERAREAILAYHLKAGRIVRVRRGLYAVIPPGANASSYPVDPYLVASKLTPDSVLSHHTALEFHGRAYSVYFHIMYSASRPLGHLTFRSNVYRGTMFPRALVLAGKTLAGVSTAEIDGMDFRVTSLERTLVDVLDRPDLSGGWEEIWRSLESVAYFNLDKVVEYALALGNATTGAKVGFFLDQHRETLMVEDSHLKALYGMRPRQPHYLERSKRTPGRLVPQWNLVVPMEVLERSWEEVL